MVAHGTLDGDTTYLDEVANETGTYYPVAEVLFIKNLFKLFRWKIDQHIEKAYSRSNTCLSVASLLEWLLYKPLICVGQIFPKGLSGLDGKCLRL